MNEIGLNMGGFGTFGLIFTSLWSLVSSVLLYRLQSKKMNDAKTKIVDVEGVEKTNQVYKDALDFSESQVKKLRSDYKFLNEQFEDLRKIQKEDRRLINALRKEINDLKR